MPFICCSAFDLEDKVVGTVGAGRIGQRVLQRLAVSGSLAVHSCLVVCSSQICCLQIPFHGCFLLDLPMRAAFGAS